MKLGSATAVMRTRALVDCCEGTVHSMRLVVEFPSVVHVTPPFAVTWTVTALLAVLGLPSHVM